jgi:hypothetical protein
MIRDLLSDVHDFYAQFQSRGNQSMADLCLFDIYVL